MEIFFVRPAGGSEIFIHFRAQAFISVGGKVINHGSHHATQKQPG
jgi:hypothetical protein